MMSTDGFKNGSQIDLFSLPAFLPILAIYVALQSAAALAATMIY